MEENLISDLSLVKMSIYKFSGYSIIRTETYYGIGEYSMHEVQIHFYKISNEKIEIIAIPSYTWRGDDKEQNKNYFADSSQEQEIPKEDFEKFCESIIGNATSQDEIVFEEISNVFIKDNLVLGIKNAYDSYLVVYVI